MQVNFIKQPFGVAGMIRGSSMSGGLAPLPLQLCSCLPLRGVDRQLLAFSCGPLEAAALLTCGQSGVVLVSSYAGMKETYASYIRILREHLEKGRPEPDQGASGAAQPSAAVAAADDALSLQLSLYGILLLLGWLLIAAV